ncbi:hypothetical protein [Streptomyces silvensis]|uniref:Uncharacterized protein n=1 Tax=Streptomyces silvensis TaxID=1765722 RepID=A0A0W7X4H4_9ACTN|nr:hypothetical protein [Streptomyces silvensis]KUF17814.1 hypothetical protein AT728_10580 [Streptomyces silvensis]
MLAAASLASGLTACGEREKPVRLEGGVFTERKPADRARGEALAAEGMGLLQSADSLRIVVEMERGPAAGGTRRSQEVGLHLDRDGNCAGTFDAGNGQRGDLIMVAGGATYVRFTEDSLEAMRTMARARGPQALATVEERIALVRGKYMKLPAGAGGRGGRAVPGAQCDLDTMLRELDGGEDTFDGQVRAEAATYRYGKHVIPLVDPNPVGGEANAMYVAAEGKPYITALVMNEDGRRMTMHMSDYGKPVEAHAPPAAQTVDASELGGPAGADLFEV